MCKRADYVRFSESFSYLFGTLTRSAVKEIHITLVSFTDLRYWERLEGADNERAEKAG